MRTVTSFERKRLARGAGFVALGGLGSLALTFPLFGALGYMGSLFLPLPLAWFAGSLVFAVLASGRLARAYLFGNLGMLAATTSVFVVVWIRLVISGQQPNPTVAAPLYLALVVAGLVLGALVGAGRPQPQA
jgi:hypothetical protein